ncbi:MAG: hypothetical protein H7Y38_13595 [Armatimonadetes bacterium]|nr:hypothetical protein [Armatimonadota bacterium]
MLIKSLLAATVSLLTLAAGVAFAQNTMPGMTMPAAPKQDGISGTKMTVAAPRNKPLAGRIDPATLPTLPANLPKWMSGRGNYEVFYKRGSYNFRVYDIPALAYDFNATGVGHSMAYEEMVRGNAGKLETETFGKIDRVLKNPPKLAPTEKSIAPTFSRRFGLLEQVFDWAHTLHFQTIDVLADPKMTEAQKDAEIARLYKNYRISVPFALSPLPMNMGYLYNQPYSKRMRDNYPKVNGLFWGYHWLQTSVYDTLYGKTPEEQKKAYDLMGARYRGTELYKTDRPFMPMTAETSPRFSKRFPELANVFDNLHMLHDMVNDILVSPDLTGDQKDVQVKTAIWMTMEAAHQNEKPGDFATGETTLHDHRFMDGMPGMGIMPGGTKELMYMPEADMGWMSMEQCHHCSMPLPEEALAWKMSTVTSQGVTMQARCALCARDYTLETEGSAIVQIPTENPARSVVLITDDKGEYWTRAENEKNVVFIEDEGSHAGCSEWSQAFSSRGAFDKWVAANPDYKGAKPYTLKEWWAKQGKKPDTYYKPKGPVENPYANEANRKPEGEKP